MTHAMKTTWSICVTALIVVVLAALYFTAPGHTPAGQPPLIEMNSQAISGLQAEFNRDASNVRVILLLSPT